MSCHVMSCCHALYSSRHDFANDGFNPSHAHMSPHPKLLAYRYRVIRDLYERVRSFGGLSQAMNHAATTTTSTTAPVGWMREIEDVRNKTDSLSGGWLHVAREIIMIIHTLQHQQVLVSNGQLIPTLAKLLLYDLCSVFPCDHVYSSASSHHPKSYCFDKIGDRFGTNVHYIVIGDGYEEERASISLGKK